MGQPGPDGELNFAEMAGAAERVGLHPVALEAGRAAFDDLPMPAIVQVHDSRFPDELPHFLVLLRPESDGMWLLDAPFPAYFLPEDRFKQSWTGKIMIFAESQAEADRIKETSNRYDVVMWAASVLLVVGLLPIGYITIKWVKRIGPNMARGLAVMIKVLGGRGQPGWSRIHVGTLIVFFFLGGGLAAVLVRQHARSLPPECIFDEPVIDLGELKRGGQKALVSMQNQGDELLQIAEIQSSCSCAIVNHPTTISPHDSALIDVELNVGPGPGGAHLTVLSNDPTGAKHVSLRWHGKTVPFLNPRWIADSEARLDRPYERTIYLLYPGGKSALRPKLEGFECPNASIEIRAGRDDPLATRFATSGLLTKILGQVELHLRIKPTSVPSIVRTVCLLNIKYGEDHLKIRLPILLTFSGGQLSSSASAVTFSAANQKELISQVRTVTVTDQDPNGELEVGDVPRWLSCNIERKNDREHVIQVKLLKAPETALAQQSLIITRKNKPNTSIPLKVNVLVPSS
jgi:hypothetical protein